MSDLSFIKPYKQQFEAYLKEAIPSLCEKSKLRDACEYALLNGGKRIRPVIVLMMAKALGFQKIPLEASLSVEFFHTASLIADDLPCMDNDDFRREKPAIHKVFGETVALLASYALMTEGFEMIYQMARKASNEVGMLALSFATKGSGIRGATGGQFLDLFPKGHQLEEICQVIEMKTITLFETAFVFGWLFGGGEIVKLELIKGAAYHFGMAFQIVDDLDDLEQDQLNEKSPNLAFCLGHKKALLLLKKEIQKFESIMKKLQIFNLEFQELTKFLNSKLRPLAF